HSTSASASTSVSGLNNPTSVKASTLASTSNSKSAGHSTSASASTSVSGSSNPNSVQASTSTSVSGSNNPNSVSLSNSASAVLPKAGEANSFDLTIAGAGLLGALGVVVSKKKNSSK
ncbi:LPXTG cell wall anchor domain-containing protein, partial [Lactococcus lactis]